MFMLYPTCVYFWSIWPITSTMFYFYHVHWMRDIPRVIHNICGHLCNAKAHLNAHLNAHCGNLRSTMFKYASISGSAAILSPSFTYLTMKYSMKYSRHPALRYITFSDTHTCGHRCLSALFSIIHILYGENVHKMSQLLLFHFNYLFECV